MKPNPFAFTSIRPVCHLVVTLLGLMCASASATIYYWDASSGLNNGIGDTGSLSTSLARWSLSNTGDATLTTLGAAGVTTSDTLTFAGTAGTVTWSSNYSSATNHAFNVTGYTIATSNTSARLLNGTVTLADNVNLAFTNTVDGGAVGVSTTGITGGSGSGITLVGATGGLIFDVTGGASIAASAPISITAVAGTTSVAIRGTSSGAVNAGITNNSSVSTTLTAGSSTSSLNLILNGKITGSQGVTFNAGQGTTAGGQVQLGFANDYTGETRFNGAADSLKSSSKGSVKLLLNDGISTASSSVVMGYSNGRGENFDLNGFNQSVASLTSNSGGTGAIINTATTTDSLLTINGAATGGSFGLQIQDGASKKVALTRSGVGTTTLTNTNTYTGGTIVSGGSLVLGHATDTLANSGAVTVSGGILDLGSNSDSVGAVIISSGSITGSSGTLTGSSYTASGTSGLSTISAKLGGASSALAVTGSGGTLLLSGANSYDGATSISSGATLKLGNTSALGTTTGIGSGGAIVNSGAAASFGGAITLAANSSVGLSSGDITLSGNISQSGGTRNLTLVGTGRLILSGSNNYTGTTTLGLTTKLQVNLPAALASGSTLVTSNTGTGNTSELNLATADNSYALGSLTLGSIFNLTAPVSGTATLTFTNGGAQIGTSGKTLNPGANTTLVVGGTVGGSNFDLIGSTATTDRSLTLGGAGSTIVNSILRDNASGGAAGFKGGITKSGNGTATLNAANIYTGTTTVSGGVLRLENATAVTGGIAATGGASNIAFSGGVIGLTATSGDFNRAVGTGVDQVIWTTANSGTRGFAAYGGDRTVNLGGSGAQVAWLAAGPFGANGLILGATDSDSTITFANPINMNSSIRTVTVNDGAAATDAVMTGVLSSNLASLNKAGTGTLALTAINTYGGDTTVGAGTLHLRDDARLMFLIGATSGTSNSISGAGTLILDGNFAIDITAASALANGTWTLENVPALTGAYGSTFTVMNPDGSLWTDAGGNKWTKDGGDGKIWTFDETTGVLTLGSAVVATPFQSWAQSSITDINPAADATPAGDPDNDGRSNLAEFAFNGNPLSGSDNGRVYVLTEDTDYVGDPSSARELILTVAVRAGTAVFAGTPSPNAAQMADGITYSIEGGVNLGSFLTPVNVVPTAVTTALPAAGTGYEYRSFSLDGSNGLAGKGFLRVKVTSP